MNRTGLAAPGSRAWPCTAIWFQLSDDQRRQHGSPMGPAQPQALNRYSYVLNNPMRWTDPGGHFGVTVYPNGKITFHLNHEEATALWDFMLNQWFTVVGFFKDLLAGSAQMAATNALAAMVEKLASIGFGGAILAEILKVIGTAAIAVGATAAQIIGLGILLLTGLGMAMAFMDWLGGGQGLDISLGDYTNMVLAISVNFPTVERQTGVWEGDRKICAQASFECVMQALTHTSPRG